jgi:TPR repeat protein
MSKALEWYRKAAEAGHGYAQYTLASKYRHGTGVPQDVVEAYRWLMLAVPHFSGDERVAFGRELDELGKGMTAAQVTEARQRANAWTAAYERQSASPAPSASPDEDASARAPVRAGNVTPPSSASDTATSARTVEVVINPAVLAELRTNMTRWRDAKIKHDLAELGRLMAPDFVEINQDGARLNRQQLLSLYQSTDIEITSIEVVDVRFEPVPGGILASGTHNETVKYKGRDVGGTLKFSELYVRRGSEWQLQSSRLVR